MAAEAARSQRPVWLGEDRRTWDHVRLHTRLITDPAVTSDMLAVYAGIAVHAELASGEAHPSADTLATYASLSERTVRRCLAALSLAGWLEVEERSGKSSIYRLLPPPEISTTPVTVSGVPDLTPDTGSGVVALTPDGVTGPPRTGSPTTPVTGSDELEPRTRTTELENPNAQAREAEPPPELSVDKLARAICTEFYDTADPKPSLRYLGAVKVVTRLLNCNHHPDVIRAALPDAATISAGALEVAIRRQQRPSGDKRGSLRDYLADNARRGTLHSEYPPPRLEITHDPS